MPTLAKIYSDLGYTFKETLNTYIRSLGRDPEREVWQEAYKTIKNVYRAKEHAFTNAIKNYPPQEALLRDGALRLCPRLQAEPLPHGGQHEPQP